LPLPNIAKAGILLPLVPILDRAIPEKLRPSEHCANRQAFHLPKRTIAAAQILEWIEE